MRTLYKILTLTEWQAFQREGRFDGSVDDIRDGFVHLSYADQVAGTASKHFRGRGKLVLLALSSLGLQGQLRDEKSSGGALFPHLYGAFFARDILWARELETNAEGVPVIGVLPDQP